MFLLRCFSKSTLLVFLVAALATSCIVSIILIRRDYVLEGGGTADWVLVGGVTSTSVAFRVRRSLSAKRFVVSESSNFEQPAGGDNDTVVVYSNNDVHGSTNSSDNGGSLVTSITVSDLETNRQYSYATLDGDGTVLRQGTFRTAPSAPGTRSNFSFATAGCAWTGSKHPVFSMIHQGAEQTKDRDGDPLFFLHLGDLHYEDLNVNDVERRIRAIDRVLGSPAQRGLFGSAALVYTWDDHDWLGNDSGGSGAGRRAALESYRIAFPHYGPLPSADSSYHAFTIGTVRFVVSDLRSESTPASIYSNEQRRWLFRELGNSSGYDFVVWVTSKPWIAETEIGDDSWAGYPRDRQELSDFIRTNVTKRNVLAISSDAHMIAFDDGTNTYYGGRNSSNKDSDRDGDGDGDGDSTAAINVSSSSSFPILQSGPLDRIGSFKGGPYTEGCYSYKYERVHQYSLIEFYETENGDGNGVVSGNTGQPCLKITAYRIGAFSLQRQILFVKELCGEDIFSPSSSTSTTTTSTTAVNNPSASQQQEQQQEQQQAVGSCNVQYMSTINMGLLIAGILLLLTASIQVFLLFGVFDAEQGSSSTFSRRILWALLMIILVVLTYAVGVIIPLLKGIKQFDPFPFVVLGLVEVVLLNLYLFFWRRWWNYKSNKTSSSASMPPSITESP